MRPVTLVISGFGSYSGETKIEFNKLGENGLYLITGDTGSGKTTVFDAIAYALYGETSGENRNGGMMRSKYASPDTKTFVSLTFSNNGKTYTVTRNPAYERPKLKGGNSPSDTAKTAADAELHMPDGSIISKISDVTSKITEILGLDGGQFRQTTMIAQGEFRKLIYSSTAEREKLFRTLFNTEKYKELREKIGSDCSDAKRICDSQTEKLRSLISQIECPEDDAALSARTAEAKDGLLTNADILALLGNIIGYDRDTEKDLNTRIQKITADISAAEQSLRIADEIKKIKADLADTAAKLTEKSRIVLSLNEKHKNAVKRQPELQKISEDSSRIRNSLPAYDELDKLAKMTSEMIRKISGNEDRRLTLSNRSNELADRTASLEKERSALSDCRADYERLSAEQDKIKKHAAELEKLKKMLADLNITGEKKSASEKKCASLSQDSLSASQKTKALEQQLDELKLRSEKLLEYTSSAQELLLKRNDLSRFFDEINKLSARYSELSEKRNEHKKLLSDAAAAYNASAEAGVIYENAFHTMLANRAGLIAKTLEDGKPCPVCGAKDHPVPAKCTAEALSEEAVEKLRAVSEKKKEIASGLSSRAGLMDQQLVLDTENFRNDAKALSIDPDNFRDSFRAALEETERQIAELNLSLEDIAAKERESAECKKKISDTEKDLRNSRELERSTAEEIKKAEIELSAFRGRYGEQYNAAKLLLEELAPGYSPENSTEFIVSETRKIMSAHGLNRSRLENAGKNVERSKTLNDLIPQLTEEKRKLDTDIASLSDKLSQDNRELGKLRGQAENITAALEFSNRTDAENKLRFLDAEHKKINSEIENTRNELISAQKTESELNGKKTQLEKHLSSLPDVDEEKTKASLDSLELEKKRLNNRLLSVHSRSDSNSSLLEKFKVCSAETKKAENRYSMLLSLDKTVSGSISGREKLNLETYIQLAYFDRILVHANRRLEIMSDGMYSLIRKTDDLGKKSQTGLDLDVVDHTNGSVRSVRSLSGGESFMASLALALGLSEEVQSSAGGVKIDTMFIDEGFGSLDENTLRLAVKVLNGLSEGGKLIGIISHIAELKDRIDKQIVVTKSPAGSSAEVRV